MNMDVAVKVEKFKKGTSSFFLEHLALLLRIDLFSHFNMIELLLDIQFNNCSRFVSS
jgi:hypothetical protein